MQQSHTLLLPLGNAYCSVMPQVKSACAARKEAYPQGKTGYTDIYML